MSVAGKTGTAQSAKGAAPHAWFIAFAPADDPKVAVAVVVEDGGNAGNEAVGGRVAAPIAQGRHQGGARSMSLLTAPHAPVSGPPPRTHPTAPGHRARTGAARRVDDDRQQEGPT